MAGERTPDTSPPGRAGSSDDEISLREHLQRQLDLQRQNGLQMFEEQRVYFERVIADLLIHVMATFDERDKRYEQRYAAQQTAVTLAMSSVDKEFREHLIAVRLETKAALDNADKAITKSEIATDKRFTSVDEFRTQLADLIRSFMPRGEAEVRLQGIADRTEVNATAINQVAAIQSERINKLELSVTNRLSATDGKSTGRGELVAWIFAGAGFLATIAGLLAYAAGK